MRFGDSLKKWQGLRWNKMYIWTFLDSLKPLEHLSQSILGQIDKKSKTCEKECWAFISFGLSDASLFAINLMAHWDQFKQSAGDLAELLSYFVWAKTL